MDIKTLKALVKSKDSSAGEVLAELSAADVAGALGIEDEEKIQAAQERLDALGPLDRAEMIRAGVRALTAPKEREKKPDWYSVPGGGYVRRRDIERLTDAGFQYLDRRPAGRYVDMYLRHGSHRTGRLEVVGRLRFVRGKAFWSLYVWPEPWRVVPEGERTRYRKWSTEPVDVDVAPLPEMLTYL